MNGNAKKTGPLPLLLVDRDSEMYVDEPVYDPDVHLQLTEPDFVVLLDGFKHVPKAEQLEKPLSASGESQVAYTGPFRVLSDEGYRVLREVLQREMSYQISDERHPAKIRFGAYRSKWLQDFNRCPRVAEHLSRMLGDVHLIPTTLQSNYSHTNIGYASSKRVDQFHRDSVPYVLILLACDTKDIVGGELQLIERNPDEAFRVIEENEGKVPEQYLRTIDYLGENTCVFMQGSQIVHGVTNIQSCKEPRITVVNSYMSSDPFALDYTRYDTFRKEKTGPLEFVMHKMWRAQSQMLDLGSGKHPWPTVDQILGQLDKSIGELEHCRDLLLEKTTDRVCFYDDQTKRMNFFKEPPKAFQAQN